MYFQWWEDPSARCTWSGWHESSRERTASWFTITTKKSIDNEGYIIRRIMLTNVTTNTRYRVVFWGRMVYFGLEVYIKITK